MAVQDTPLPDGANVGDAGHTSDHNLIVAAINLAAIRDSIRDILARQEQILQALADWYTYRIAVDQNAVTTDDAIICLARLESGRLSG